MGLFNAIGDAVSSVVDAVAGSDGILGTVASAIGLDDVFETFGIDQLISGSFGGFINNFMDGLGFPDIVGDIVGTMVDGASGNLVGAADNLLDAVEDVVEEATGFDVPADLVDGETFIDLIS